MREVMAAQHAQMKEFANAPVWLREGLVFPYLAGADFVNWFTRTYPGRQPFGGNRLSGTGTKAGGPGYLLQFVEPRVVTSRESEAWRREPSGSVASTSGSATEMCFPDRWTSWSTIRTSTSPTSTPAPTSGCR